MIDLNAPIIPFESIGGIKLYSKLEDVYENVIKHEDDVKIYVDKWNLRFELAEKMVLAFCNSNGKLWSITARDEYSGKLFSHISNLMDVKKILKLEPSFKYDEWEEIYYSQKLGMSFKEDMHNNIACDLSIAVKETITMENTEFWEGNW